MRDLQNAVARGGQLRQNRALDLRTNVTEQQHRHVVIHHFENDGVVITNALALSTRQGRMQDADLS